MTDLTSTLLPQLTNRQFTSFPTDREMVCPYYEGYSSVNLPSTICRLLDIPEFGAPLLNTEITSNLGDHYDNIILLLVDGLSLFWFQRYLAEGYFPIWSKLVKQGVLAPLTAIAPSTTASALTTLWTGKSTFEHGITGYEMWLKEYGIVTNMISQGPMAFRNDNGGLRRAGFQPEAFLTVPTLGVHLVNHGIHPHAFLHQSIARSGLTAMHMAQVETHGFTTQADLWISLGNIMKNCRHERKYIWVYWGDFDEVAHRFGPHDRRVNADFDAFSMQFERLFVNELANCDLKNTLFLLTADHGFITTPKCSKYNLRSHPDLMKQFTIMPTGENRLAYFHIRPNRMEAVKDYIHTAWKNEFIALSIEETLESGLLGQGVMHPQLEERIGDLVVIAKDNHYFWWSDKENHMQGRHGGMSADEMLIPLLAAPL